jgi:glutathione synthase/RimK-type ligase-like ATP-grasp enzyme
MILILTNNQDPHADKVVEILRHKKILALRLNSDTVCPSSHLSFDPKRDKEIQICSAGYTYHLKEITAIWYRKPHFWFTDYSKVSAENAMANDFKLQELLHFYDMLMHEANSAQIFAVNNIEKLLKARNKPLQLHSANSIGFKIPNTLITSSPDQVESFLENHGGTGIIKVMDKGFVRYANKSKRFLTYPILLSEYRKYRKKGVFDHPLFIQEEIKKAFELRVTVIGEKVFSCKIHSQDNPESRLDWRRSHPDDLKYEAFSLPNDVKQMCRNLCKHLELAFGAIDLAVTTSGEFVFFEINPNGQYLFLEQKTGLPLSMAMAELLSTTR